MCESGCMLSSNCLPLIRPRVLLMHTPLRESLVSNSACDVPASSLANSHPRESFLLSIDELRDLTGYRAHHGQTTWLQSNGIAYRLDRCGRPKVLRAVVQQVLGLSAQGDDAIKVLQAPLPSTTVAPDFAALQSLEHCKPFAVAPRSRRAYGA